MSIVLKKLSRNDGSDVFDMLKGIEEVENSFTNPTYRMTYFEFQKWLLKQEQWDRGENLPNGYVPQSIFWLYDECCPVGIGKIRHRLTENSRKNGGNIGYAICKKYRGRGYGSVFLKLLLEESRIIGVNEVILTVDRCNIASKRVCEKNGGILFDENDERFFFKFEPNKVLV